MTRNATATQAIIYVVDDDELVRKAMARKFKSLGFQVVTFASAREFLDSQRADLPGCLLLDVEMPGQTGIELQQELARHHVDLPIVFMSAHGNIPMVVKAVQDGAVDFLPKPVDEQQLVQTVRQAIDRHGRQLAGSAALREFRQRVDTLTKRESEVMTLVVSGLPNKRIARRLGITENTVKVHRSHVMKKIGVDSVAELVRLYERSGTTPLDQSPH